MRCSFLAVHLGHSGSVAASASRSARCWCSSARAARSRARCSRSIAASYMRGHPCRTIARRTRWAIHRLKCNSDQARRETPVDCLRSRLRGLPERGRTSAGPHIALPTRGLGACDARRSCSIANAFAGLVVEGMLLRQLLDRRTTGARSLRARRVRRCRGSPSSDLVAEYACRAVEQTNSHSSGSSSSPRPIAGLDSSPGCRPELPTERTDSQRSSRSASSPGARPALAMLWLLAESWGRVTPAGTAFHCP